MWRRPEAGGELALAATLREPRNRFWRARVDGAIEEGRLRRAADPAVVSTLLVQVFNGVLADWISGEITPERLRAEARLGIAVALLAFAARPASARLRAMAADLHRQLGAGRRSD